ncbi:MAG: hypothetical protein ACYTG7_02400, partial [Planctomycetota bacterium]
MKYIMAITMAALLLLAATAEGEERNTLEQFVIYDLDPGGVVELAAAFRIAETGAAVGLALPYGAEYSQPALWAQGATAILPTLPDHESGTAFDISNGNIIVGESDDVQEVGHQIHIYPFAVVWIEGEPIELASLVTGGDDLELKDARRINEKGQIMGWGRDASIPTGRAYIFDSGIVRDLGSLKPDGPSTPMDMNEQGHVVGESMSPDNWDHAFLWKNNVMIDLHDPAVMPGKISSARAINEFGVIAGGADFIEDFIYFETAAIWDHGTIIDLGTLGGDYSFARDINDHDTVVGVSINSDHQARAFIYQGDKMVDLNDIATSPSDDDWILTNAHGIANDGTIVGEGFHHGMLRPFIAYPDTNGGFRIYGAGCAGSLGFTPGLYGQGDPTADGEISIVAVNGYGSAPCMFLFGTGYDIFEFKPGCFIQILPLLPIQILITLQGTGAGAGVWKYHSTLPSDLIPATITLQLLLMDP